MHSSPSALRRAVISAAAVTACSVFAAAASAGIPVKKIVNVDPIAVAAATPFAPCPLLAFGLNCYGPYEIGAAYDYPTTLDGAGQTIVIVDAYRHPFMPFDLHVFDGVFGVQQPAPGQFVQVNGPRVSPPGSGSGDVDGWGGEVALDVEWAHAMAPGAKIVLVQAATDDDADIAAAEAAFLPQYPGAIVSQSFGLPEQFVDPASAATYHAIFQAATAQGGTLVASTGDWGATWTPVVGPGFPAMADFPASDPLVTGIGGTQGLTHDGSSYGLGLLPNGSYGDEQVWNEPQFDLATGGAPSVLFAAPPWQRAVSAYKTRTVPDVSYNAAANGGVVTIHTDENPASPDYGTTSFFLTAGTSAGVPQWAAIFSLVDQARAQAGKGPLGFANESLYRIGRQTRSTRAFHDVTVGGNALDSPIGFDAGPGYDVPTGWGTPDVARLVQALAAAPAASNPDAGAPAAAHPLSTTGRLRPHTQLPG